MMPAVVGRWSLVGGASMFAAGTQARWCWAAGLRGGICFPYGYLCNLPDFTVPRTCMGPCVAHGWLKASVRSRQSRFSLFILGSHSFPRGGVAFIITIRVADAYSSVVFLGCIRLDGEPVCPVSAGVQWQPVVSMRPGHLELWFISKPARTRADAPTTKNALHQQARARHGQLDTACLELQPRGPENLECECVESHISAFSPSLRHGTR